jgi:hypothetical protein
MNLEFDRIFSLQNEDDLPEEIKKGNCILICESGILSGRATTKLLSMDIKNVYNLLGGIQEWKSLRCEPGQNKFCTLNTVDGEGQPFPYRESSLVEQLSTTLAAFMIKPLYMLLSFILIILLWKRKDKDLAGLRYAMIFFFIGEAFCAVNFLFFDENSNPIEFLHSYGMVLSFCFATFAIIEAFDSRIIHISDMEKRCSLLTQCKECYKNSVTTCKAKQLFKFIIPMMIIISIIPLLSPLLPISYNTDIFYTYYNYSHSTIFQVFEARLAPVSAILLYTVSLMILILKKENDLAFSKIFFSMATGFIGFSYFRVVLLGIYQHNMTWFVSWEEFTELIFIAGVAVVLWIFREKLLGRGKRTLEKGIEH